MAPSKTPSPSPKMHSRYSTALSLSTNGCRHRQSASTFGGELVANEWMMGIRYGFQPHVAGITGKQAMSL